MPWPLLLLRCLQRRLLRRQRESHHRDSHPCSRHPCPGLRVSALHHLGSHQRSPPATFPIPKHHLNPKTASLPRFGASPGILGLPAPAEPTFPHLPPEVCLDPSWRGCGTAHRCSPGSPSSSAGIPPRCETPRTAQIPLAKIHEEAVWLADWYLAKKHTTNLPTPSCCGLCSWRDCPCPFPRRLQRARTWSGTPHTWESVALMLPNNAAPP